jgi:hypothetical protein
MTKTATSALYLLAAVVVVVLLAVLTREVTTLLDLWRGTVTPV